MNSYFYLDKNNEQQGPIAPSQFAIYGIKADTLVWCNGMDDWAQADSIAELIPYLSAPTNAETTPPPYGGASSYTSQHPGTQPGINVNVNQATQYVPYPNTNLVWAILSTLCCCLPTGIVAIIYSCQVSRKYARGDYQGAMQASANAMKWAIAGMIISIVISLLYGLFVIVMMGAGLSSAL